MTEEQKAVKQLESYGISAHENDGAVYIGIDDHEFEIARNEIAFQADMYDANNEEE